MAHCAGENWPNARLSQALTLPFKIYKSQFYNWLNCTIMTSSFLLCKVFIDKFSHCKRFNFDRWNDAITNRPPHVGLITVSNHHCCVDDPGLLGLLPASTIMNYKLMRWTLAANNICFTNFPLTFLFSCGRVVPVVRGDGIYQPGVDWAIEKLDQGDWVHIFPEGGVNMAKTPMRIKWGISRLIMEAKVPPIVLPYWHEGMDDLLPNYKPYIPRPYKKVTFNVGQPIQIDNFLEDHRRLKLSLATTRIRIANHIQDRLYELGRKTSQLHLARSQ